MIRLDSPPFEGEHAKDTTTDGPKRSVDSKTQRVGELYRSLRDKGADPNEWAYAWRRELNRGGFERLIFLWLRSWNPASALGVLLAWRFVLLTCSITSTKSLKIQEHRLAFCVCCVSRRVRCCVRLTTIFR